MKNGRTGFTLLEMTIVIVIIGILINIAIPSTQMAKRRAIAAATVADVSVIRSALFDYYADNGSVPRTSGWGVAPPDLAGSLPGGFTFGDHLVRYRWQRYGVRRQRRTGQFGRVQVRVLSRDNELAAAIRGLFHGRTTGRGRTLSLVIE